MSHRKGYFTLVDGFKIAYQEWGIESSKKVIALHGWQDNSNSFSILGPYVASKGFHFLAFDHHCHGLSSHGPSHYSLKFTKYINHVKEITSILQWQKPIVIGHRCVYVL